MVNHKPPAQTTKGVKLLAQNIIKLEKQVAEQRQTIINQADNKLITAKKTKHSVLMDAVTEEFLTAVRLTTFRWKYSVTSKGHRLNGID
jgi:hypothetical protein